MTDVPPEESTAGAERTGPEAGRFTALAVNALFPTHIYCRDYPDADELNATLLDLARRLRAEDPEGHVISARGGWQSQQAVMRMPEARPLIRFLDDTLLEIKQFLSAADNVRFFVTSCWINVNGHGGYNRSHIHGNSYFSGVYYVQVPPDCGLIEFRDPSYLREYYTFGYKAVTPQNCFAQSFQPVPGRVFIFPGYLPHAVGENRSAEERVSVAFNVSARSER